MSGESDIDAAKRELKEELGINYTDIKLVKKYNEELNSNGIDNKEVVSIFIMYLDDTERKFKLQKEEVSNAKWFTKIEMEKID